MTSSMSAGSDARLLVGELESTALVAPGTAILWDPAVPWRCAGVVPFGSVRTALGDRARGGAWLRLAALHTFDRLLYLRLNRALLDGEMAVAEYAAARTLSGDDPLRESLVESALGRARDASPGVWQYLEHLVVGHHRIPRLLRAALERLVSGYGALCHEVREPDADLSAVLEAWRQLSVVDAADGCRRGPPRPPAPARSAPAGEDFVDPRSVPGRLLRLGPTADSAEIDVVATHWKGRPAVRVRVAAFGDGARPANTADVGVRLIDRRSGAVCGHGLLGGLSTTSARSLREVDDHYFEGIVELPDAVAAGDVRVHLDWADGAEPPPPAGTDELRRVRRATLFLSGWRALVADVRLCGGDVAPAQRLREITRLLVSDDGQEPAAAPLWAGGPSAAALRRLADRGDQVVAALAVPGRRTRLPGGIATVAEMISGPGDLLVAEIAAAHERSAAE